MNQVRNIWHRLTAPRGVLSMLLVVSIAATVAGTPTYGQSSNSARAKNVILLIGDGMGDSEITIARNYYLGAAGRLALDSLPMTGAYTTYALQESNPNLPDYVTDSAASGTGWSTGVKTSNGRISTTASSNLDVKTILEWAKEAGFRTGDVSTAELTDATPAVLASHVNDRGCQGPANMGPCPQDKKEAGGPGSIAEQEVDHGVDVLLGGGKSRFDQVITGGPDVGRTVIQSAQRQGYLVVTDTAHLQGVQPGQKVLGLFTAGNMTTEWSGQLAAVEPGTGPQVCKEGQRPPNEPALSYMTQKALQLLDRSNSAENQAQPDRQQGFFLQVEGASIDKRDHAADPCGQIGETIAFDRAVQVAINYAKAHDDTLVIVTADHAHTSQIIPVESHSPGQVSKLITADGSVMKLNYATNLPGQSQEHTGTQLRIAAKGPGSEGVTGVTDQTDLFYTMARALRIGPPSRPVTNSNSK